MLKQRVPASIFLIVLVFFNIPSLEAVETNLRDCGLRCWLQNLTVLIPDQSTTVDGFKLTLTNMVCNQFNLGAINSTFVPPTSLDFFPNGIGGACVADWTFEEQDIPYLSGSGTVDVSLENSQINLQVDLIEGSDNLVKSASVTSCSTDIVIASIDFKGGMLDKILEFFRSFIKSMLQSEINDITCTELSSLIETNLTQALHNVNEAIAPYMKPQPPHPGPPVPEGAVNFHHNTAVDLMDYAATSLLGPDGLLSLNMIVDHLTDSSGSVHFEWDDLDLYNFNLPVQGVGSLTVGLKSLDFDGLDTWGEVYVSPFNNYSISLFSTMARLEINVTFFVNITTEASLEDHEFLYEEGQLFMKLSNNDLNATMQVILMEETLKSLEGTQFYDIGCLLKGLDNANLTQLWFNMSVDLLRIEALSGDLERDLDLAIDNVIELFTKSYGGAIPGFWNGFIAEPARQQLNNLIGKYLAFPQVCHPPKKQIPGFNLGSSIISYSAAGAVIVFVAALLLIVQRRRHSKLELHEETRLLYKPHETEYNPPSLFFHPSIPIFVRYLVPALVVLNIATFISSNTSVGASVYLLLTAGGAQVRSPPLFSFSLANSVHDMWRAGVYPLSILIAVLSGAWPYLKLVMMLGCWFVSPKRVGEKRRENVLMLLDMLGKWSLIDAFVMTLMVVAFRLTIASPAVPDINPPEVGYANVIVDIAFGFYSFLFATMMSLALTHFILALHHHAVSSERPEGANEEVRQSLSVYAFSSSVLGKIGRIWVTILLLLSAGLIIYGCVIPSFAFEFKGATGWALELLGINPERSYSIISLGLQLPYSSVDPNGFGIRWIQTTFFAFTVVVPLLHFVVLLFLWVFPLALKTQRRVFVVAEILNAWSALEVFIVSVIAALLEIRQFASFIIGNQCDQVNVFLKEYFAKQLDNDDVCFEVRAYLLTGCWVLFGACIIYLVVGNLVMRTCHKALSEAKQTYVNTLN